MNDVEAFLSNSGLLYHGLPPVLYADNGASQAVADYDAGRFNRREADAKYRQRRKEAKNPPAF